ncbi:hypothetical protein SteCoe_12076 [Stentor coeruleus]|uniref:ADP-ribosylation factor n=1 Tax=Stentor coeruleus TaxID=5963 RepID=A0A1R2CBP3_9CILI|nr:hypothetical protein SteCoe_12076 [Stentor coeruleus]
MGQIFSNAWQKVFKYPRINIIVVGLDASGKTTILYKSKFGEVLNSQSLFYSYETVDNRELSIKSWDLGGSDRSISSLYKRFYENVQGIIFVVDSNDRYRIEDAYYELDKILKDNQLNDAVLLVFANKQDLPEAMKPDEIARKFKLYDIQGRNWLVQDSCACMGRGYGISEGFEWLLNEIHKKNERKFG